MIQDFFNNYRLISVVCLAVALLGHLSGCGSELTSSQRLAIQKASETFQQAKEPGDFQQSAKEFQKIVDSGVQSGAVFCLQGNAFAQAGDKPRALAAYRQAFPYMPNNAYLLADMKTMGAKPEKTPLIEHLLFWQNWFSYPAKQTIVFVLAAITLIIALIPWISRKKEWKIATLILTLLTGIAVSSFVYDYYRFDVLKRGVVLESTTARKGDSETYAAAFTQPLSSGTEFRVLQTRGDWVLVQLEDDLEGWIESKKTQIW